MRTQVLYTLVAAVSLSAFVGFAYRIKTANSYREALKAAAQPHPNPKYSTGISPELCVVIKGEQRLDECFEVED